MRILHVLSQRPDSTGSGIYLQGMIREATKQGHDNRLIAAVAQGEEPSLDCLDDSCCAYVLFDSSELPFPVAGMTDMMPYRSSVFKTLTEHHITGYEAAFAARLVAAVDDFKPDIIHCHHLWLVTSLTRRLFPDIPVAASCHGTDLRQFRNCAHLRGRVLEGCGRLDAVMALSHAQRGEIIDAYGLDPAIVEVVGSGFEAEIFKPGKKHAPPPLRLVYAGKLNRPKGVIWMLRALAGLRDHPWTLDIAGGGSGPEREEIEQFAKTMHERVKIHGPLPQNELARLMARSHIFVLPSLFEGLPLVLLEAMACGLKVVVTALPGVAEVFRGYLGGDVTLVDLPRLIGVDTPHPDDEEDFVLRLRGALHRQIELSLVKHTETDPDTVGFVASHTWPGVFGRVQSVYERTIDRKKG